MNSSTEPYLPYEQIRSYASENPVRQAAVPVEYSLSLPLPTRRSTVPGYAIFAGPAVRSPGRPLRLAVPKCWLVVAAQQREVLLYAHTAALAFASTTLSGPVSVTAEGRSIAAVQEDLKTLAELLDRAAPAFFAGEQGDATLRTDLGEMLGAVLPSGAMPWYRQLVPDLFAWLDGGEPPP
jgi:hypothetical protein